METTELVVRAQLGSEVVAVAIDLLFETQRLKDTLDFAIAADDSPDTCRAVDDAQQGVCDIIELATNAVATLRGCMERRSGAPRVAG